jgi:hypothetical protein
LRGAGARKTGWAPHKGRTAVKLTTFKDIDAPIDWVFQQLCDFPAFERQAMRRGAEVRRIDGQAPPGIGNAWNVRFQFRGKEREMRAEVVEFDTPNLLQLDATSAGIDGATRIETMALSRTRTRLTFSLVLTAKSLGNRLLLQSLKLTQGNINRQFDTRIGTFARDLQDRYRRSRP